MTLLGKDLGRAEHDSDGTFAVFDRGEQRADLWTLRMDQQTVYFNNTGSVIDMLLSTGHTVRATDSDDSVKLVTGEYNDLPTGEVTLDGVSLEFANKEQVTLEGKAGDDMISVVELLEDVTATVDGGSGFDTSLFEGTQQNDVIQVSQTSVNTLSRSVNDVTGVDTFSSMEAIRIEMGAGDDVAVVSQTDSLDTAPDDALRFDVIGEAPQASDVLVVIDDDEGDTILLQQAPDDRSGSVLVGHLPAINYAGIEDVAIAPLDPVTSGTGSDGAGRVIVLDRDPFEWNDARLSSTDLDAVNTSRHHPTIYAPAVSIGEITLRGDEDWYLFRAPKTGTFRIDVFYEPLGGLPGGGELDVQLYNASAGMIVAGELSGKGEQVTFSATRDQEYYLRVTSHTGMESTLAMIPKPWSHTVAPRRRC